MTIAVLGAGAWGTALASRLAHNGQSVVLWGRDPARMAVMAREHINPRYLSDYTLPSNLHYSSDLDQALKEATAVLVATPSHAFPSTVMAVANVATCPVRLVAWATKGLTPSGELLHTVVDSALAGRAIDGVVVSGPSFASEVMADRPTAVTVAARRLEAAEGFAVALHGGHFRAYTSTDVEGVELGGTVKNVLAIAAGIADGLGLGANARAALITRGLAEIRRLGAAMGARPETITGLSGLGDLVLTCTDDQSRNRRLGLAIGRRDSVESAYATVGQLVEGAHTARSIAQLAERFAIEMPICAEVYRILYEGRSPIQAVEALLARELKPE